MLWGMRNRAGAEGCHRHRFRHAATRLYLRIGGDVMSLQQILGHEDLATTRSHIQLKLAGSERTHERATR